MQSLHYSQSCCRSAQVMQILNFPEPLNPVPDLAYSLFIPFKNGKIFISFKNFVKINDIFLSLNLLWILIICTQIWIHWVIHWIKSFEVLKNKFKISIKRYFSEKNENNNKFQSLREIALLSLLDCLLRPDLNLVINSYQSLNCTDSESKQRSRFGSLSPLKSIGFTTF